MLQIHISIPLHNRSLLLAPDFGGRGGEGNIKKNDYFHQFEAEQENFTKRSFGVLVGWAC